MNDLEQSTQELAKATAALNNSQREVQRFISDVLNEKKPVVYKLDDYGKIRNVLFDNVKDAVTRRFPLYNDRYTLSVEDVDYSDPEDTDLAEERTALVQGKTGSRRLRGCWVLRDAVTNKTVARTARMTLMKVPRMTSRGTFIRNGKEVSMNNIMRLEPGVYCRKAPDSINAQFNIKQGTGRGFNMKLNPATGIFTLSKGTQNIPAYTVLRDMGVTDDQLREAWGTELLHKNQEAGTSNRSLSKREAFYN